ncbi:hypothetical protein GUJ93_ZPchr0006g41014 [Zizania palustris]|uniref:Uncharacterized protein n=1 Tax=Zizania palustris TaxID=103762 RepID=A0A8J5W3I8_ZIZPA|nr:hypothetical protein GUJ93_ZPchr0006g41014 [Zizania palustris]
MAAQPQFCFCTARRRHSSRLKAATSPSLSTEPVVNDKATSQLNKRKPTAPSARRRVDRPDDLMSRFGGSRQKRESDWRSKKSQPDSGDRSTEATECTAADTILALICPRLGMCLRLPADPSPHLHGTAEIAPWLVIFLRFPEEGTQTAAK